MKFNARTIFAAALISCCIIATVIPLTGCQGTKAQQIAFITTDSLGSAVDKAMVAFNDFEVAKARQIIGPQANGDAVLNWMKNDKAWQDVAKARADFNASYVAWCSANAVAATGTNAATAVVTTQFKTAAIRAGADLTALIARFVPSVKPIQ